MAHRREITMTDLYNEGTQFQKDYQALLQGKSDEERAKIESEMVEWRRALGQEPQPDEVWDA